MDGDSKSSSMPDGIRMEVAIEAVRSVGRQISEMSAGIAALQTKSTQGGSVEAIAASVTEILVKLEKADATVAAIVTSKLAAFQTSLQSQLTAIHSSDDDTPLEQIRDHLRDLVVTYQAILDAKTRGPLARLAEGSWQNLARAAAVGMGLGALGIVLVAHILPTSLTQYIAPRDLHEQWGAYLLEGDNAVGLKDCLDQLPASRTGLQCTVMLKAPRR